MSNHALQKNESHVPQTQAPLPVQEILSTDITIPSLLLMQGLSDFVTERKAQMGDIVRSTTIEKLGEPEKEPLHFVPLKITMAWAEQEKIGTKFEFRRLLERTAKNEHLPWSFWRNAQGTEFDKPGQLGANEWRRVKSINVFALLPADVDAFEAEIAKAAEAGEIPDLNRTVLPVSISFRSTSFNAGKTVTTFFAQVAEMAEKAGLPNLRPWHYQLGLTCAADKNEKGSFFVWDVKKPSKLDKKYLPHVERWVKVLNQTNVKVDSTGDRETAEGQAF